VVDGQQTGSYSNNLTDWYLIGVPFTERKKYFKWPFRIPTLRGNGPANMPTFLDWYNTWLDLLLEDFEIQEIKQRLEAVIPKKDQYLVKNLFEILGKYLIK
jgi:hypothetical protein